MGTSPVAASVCLAQTSRRTSLVSGGVAAPVSGSRPAGASLGRPDRPGGALPAAARFLLRPVGGRPGALAAGASIWLLELAPSWLAPTPSSVLPPGLWRPPVPPRSAGGLESTLTTAVPVSARAEPRASLGSSRAVREALVPLPASAFVGRAARRPGMGLEWSAVRDLWRAPVGPRPASGPPLPRGPGADGLRRPGRCLGPHLVCGAAFVVAASPLGARF